MQSRPEKKRTGIYLYAREKEKARSIWMIYETSLVLAGVRRIEGKICWEGDHLGSEPDQGADFIYYEVSDRQDMERLKKIRSDYPTGLLTVHLCGLPEPQEIVTPFIRVASLLSREADEEEIRRALWDQITLAGIWGQTPGIPRRTANRVMVSMEGRRIILPAEKIIYMEAKDKGVLMHSSEGELFFHGTLTSYEGSGGGCLVRIHKGSLVNVTHIIQLNLPESCVILSNYKEVPLSRRCRALLLKALKAVTGPISY